MSKFRLLQIPFFATSSDNFRQHSTSKKTAYEITVYNFIIN
jgi:hypothetical protein